MTVIETTHINKKKWQWLKGNVQERVKNTSHCMRSNTKPGDHIYVYRKLPDYSSMGYHNTAHHYSVYTCTFK